MILTLTPNPSIDRTVTLDGPLARGEVQRVDTVTSQAGGKGVNISRAAVGAGIPTVAVLPAADDDAYVLEIRRAGITCHPVEPAGPVRTNLTVTEPDGTTTKLNSPGATVTARVLDHLARAVLEQAPGADWVVLAGSLPPGTPVDWYAQLVGALHATSTRVAVDTSDEALAALVAGLPGSAPHLMKPNGDELARATGADADELEGRPDLAARAARSLVERGVDTVLATLGAQGAILVTADAAWHAVPPPTSVASTVGAGDASLFGYLLGDLRGLGPADRLALAVAYGTAAAALPGTTMPDPSQVHPELVTTRELSLDGAPARAAQS